MNFPSSLVLLLPALLASPAFANPNPSPGIQQERKLSDKLPFSPIMEVQGQSVVWEKGKPSRIFHTAPVLRFLEDQELLKGEEVLKELDVLDDQKKELEQLLDSVRRESEKFAEKLQNNKLSASNQKEWLEIHKKYQSELEGILRPRQIRRLGEVRNRIYMRIVGLASVFSPFSTDEKRRFVKLSADELNAVKQKLKAFNNKYLPEAERFPNQIVEDTLDLLSNSHRKQLRTYIKQHPVMITNDFDVFLAQLKCVVQNETPYGLSSKEFFANFTLVTPYYKYSTSDGNLTAVRSKSIYNPMPEFMGDIIGRRGNVLEVTEAQYAAMEDVEEQLWHQEKAIEKARRKVGKNKKTIRELQEKSTHVNSQRLKLYTQSLTRQQLLMAKRLYAEDNLPNLGLISELLNGDLGRELKIDNQTKKKIRTLAKEQIEEMESKLLKWEQNLFGEIKSVLDPDNQRKFTKLLGKRFRYVVPSMHAFRTFSWN